MSRLWLVGLAAMLAFGVSATTTLAGPDAGAKARGEFKGFWEYDNARSSGRSYYVRPQAEGFRSFSYQPVRFQAGDNAIVSDNGAKVMLGKEVVGAVPAGQEFTVSKVVNGWLGTVVEVGGKQLNGWIWHAHAWSAAKAAPQTAVQNNAGQSYRRFSYQPTQRTYQRAEPRKEPWQYPKTDPRRYRSH